MLESSDAYTWGLDSEIEANRIRDEKCPECGKDTKDKGSYLRCVSCDWSITNGTYRPGDGYAVQYKE